MQTCLPVWADAWRIQEMGSDPLELPEVGAKQQALQLLRHLSSPITPIFLSEGYNLTRSQIPKWSTT